VFFPPVPLAALATPAVTHIMPLRGKTAVRHAGFYDYALNDIRKSNNKPQRTQRAFTNFGDAEKFPSPLPLRERGWGRGG